jgi:hypothetical protein
MLSASQSISSVRAFTRTSTVTKRASSVRGPVKVRLRETTLRDATRRDDDDDSSPRLAANESSTDDAL